MLSTSSRGPVEQSLKEKEKGEHSVLRPLSKRETPESSPATCGKGTSSGSSRPFSLYRDKEAASPGATAAWAAAALGCPSPWSAGAGAGLLPPSLPLLPPACGTRESNRCPHLACLPFCMPKPCWRTRQRFCPPVKMTSPVTFLMTIERKKEVAASKSQVFHLKICKSLLLPNPFLLRLQLDTQLSFLSEGSISPSFTVSHTFSQ